MCEHIELLQTPNLKVDSEFGGDAAFCQWIPHMKADSATNSGLHIQNAVAATMNSPAHKEKKTFFLWIPQTCGFRKFCSFFSKFK